MSTTMKITAKLKANVSQSGMRISGTMVAQNVAGISYPQYYGSPPQDSGSATASTTAQFTPSNFPFGVGIVTENCTTAFNVAVVNIMQQRNWLKARMGVYISLPSAPIRDCIQRINAIGGSVQVLLLPTAQDDHVVKTDAQSLSAWEALAYSQTTALVNIYKDIATDFEMLNEVDIRSEITAQVAHGAQTSQAAVSGQTAFISIGRALKGMSRAISDIRASSGLALRVILGTTSRDWGFLSYMATLGVEWDVTGYHMYTGNDYTSLLTDTFYGVGGCYGQIERFNKPWTINEWNAAEIYTATYSNVIGTSAVEAGFAALAWNTRELYQRAITTAAPCESVIAYELYDNSAKAPNEDRFGLFYSTGTAKVSAHLWTAFAGGSLSSTEITAITSRGIMSAGEITAMKHT